jgi:hypothetical protein
MPPLTRLCCRATQGKQRNCREALAKKRHRDQLKREVLQGEGGSDEVRRQGCGPSRQPPGSLPAA